MNEIGVLHIDPRDALGWISYIYDPPNPDTEIEIQRFGSAKIDRITPRRLNPN